MVLFFFKKGICVNDTKIILQYSTPDNTSEYGSACVCVCVCVCVCARAHVCALLKKGGCGEVHTPWINA